VAQLDIYIDQNCDKGTPAKRCGEANSEMQRASTAYLDVLGQGMKVSGLAFDDLQDRVLDAERQEFQGNYSIDAWMRDIGARKVSYWGGELGTKGGLAKYVERKNEATCGAYSAKPGKNDSKGLDFVFDGTESAFVKCQFLKPPANFQRDSGDYWLIRIMWSGSWELHQPVVRCGQAVHHAERRLQLPGRHHQGPHRGEGGRDELPLSGHLAARSSRVHDPLPAARGSTRSGPTPGSTTRWAPRPSM